jgi:preprotein translocase subunit SecG
MSTFETILMMLLVVDALALAGLILLQQGRGADVGAAFGSGSSNTMFGSSGATSFLTKVTAWLAIGFFVISFGLAYSAKERAAEMNLLGLPELIQQVVEEPGVPADEPADGPADEVSAEQLTPESESVDSDIPEV